MAAGRGRIGGGGTSRRSLRRPHAALVRGPRGTAIWIDAGIRDEWFLDVGAQAFRAALREAGVPDEVIYFELFEAGHMAIDYRYPLSLAWLCQRIAP